MTTEETLKFVVDLYWESEEANKRFNESTEAKGLACALAIEFHELMKKLRKAGER